MRFVWFLLTAVIGLQTQAALAECVGQNLLAAMPAQEFQALQAKADAQPFARGNFWRATRGDQEIHLIGTYHMDDPRHTETMAVLTPVLDRAKTVLVEAGPEEMSALKTELGKNPALMVITEGPSLPEQLSPEIWEKLSSAMRLRGVPPIMGAKMRPWYLSMILSIPPCAMEAMTEDRGLDAQVIEAATERGLPVQALEPYDTVFSIFEMLSKDDQLSMITSTLALEDRSEDLSVTMADTYFNEEGRLIWEFTRALTQALPGYSPERVEREFAAMQEAMMDGRNRKWIPVLTKAAQDGPVLAAFGALHLSGDEGVLALLEAEGFVLEQLPFR